MTEFQKEKHSTSISNKENKHNVSKTFFRKRHWISQERFYITFFWMVKSSRKFLNQHFFANKKNMEATQQFFQVATRSRGSASGWKKDPVFDSGSNKSQNIQGVLYNFLPINIFSFLNLAFKIKNKKTSTSPNFLFIISINCLEV